jgi:hypothetical protein
VFPVRAADAAAKAARLRVYTCFTTSSSNLVAELPTLRRLKETLAPSGVDFVAVPISPADDNAKLAAFAKQWKPPLRLVNLPIDQRTNAWAAYANALGHEPAPLAMVVTDDRGQILSTHSATANLSDLRKLLHPAP